MTMFAKSEKAMNKKKTFALRIDSNILSAVEKWAADEFRSVNGQLEWIINKALKDTKRIRKKTETETETENKN